MTERGDRIADQDARDQALDIRRSVIVQAPAGSGKTELLTQRLLKLLAGVEHPEEVLALTFTRKAAGEMRDRLLGALSRAKNDQPPGSRHEQLTWNLARRVLETDLARGWRILEHPARLRITTIDALCFSLTRQMPLLARVGANLEIAATPELLYREAASATLELLAQDHPVRSNIQTLLAHLDNDASSVKDLLARMLAKREQWLRHVLGGNESSDRERLEAAISALVASELAAVRAAMPADTLSALFVSGAASATVLAETDRDNPYAALLEQPDPDCSAASLPAWRALSGLLLTKSGDWRKRWTRREGFPPELKERKAALEALVDSLREDTRSRDALKIVSELPDARLADHQWLALQALLGALPVAAAQLEITFRQRGKVDYTAVSRAALDALGGLLEPSDLALALDYRIQHILVDEFQDTSASQYELLNQLIAGWMPEDGRTLFCVGDPMQSIYRFREAEVGLFLRAWQEGIGDLPLTPVSLSVNFRSQQGVVDWVNQNFPEIMPARADAQTAAVPFTRSDAFHGPGEGKPVQFHALVDASAEDEAQRLAQLVHEYRTQDAKKSIAVLVSGRNHLREIMPVLREQGHLPQAVEIERLDRIPVVHDLVALTRALLHPGDRSAWLSVLRAPWSGLSLADLFLLAQASKDATLWSVITAEQPVVGLSKAGATALRHLTAALQPVLENAGRRSLRRWVEGAWRRLGGPACLAAETEIANAESYFALLATLSAEDAVEDPAVLEQRLSELYASPDPAADPNLWVMTVHKAKGLQFDVVILPGLDRGSSHEARQLLRWMEIPRSGGSIDLVLSPLSARETGRDRLDDYLRRLEQRRRDLERARLLYVAVTRAREHVHLLAKIASKEKDGERSLSKPRAGTLLDILWGAAQPWYEAELARQARAEPSSSQSRDSSLVVSPRINRLPGGWQVPLVANPVTIKARLRNRTSINEEAIRFDWAGQTARHVGTAVHEALRMLADLGANECSAGLAEQVASRLLELGVRRSELAEARGLAMTALERTCNDERGRWVLSAGHIAARNELALTCVEGGVLATVVLDRTFIDSDGVRWIVDYKIGVHEGRDREAFFDQEVDRYKTQLQRYAQIMARCEARPIKTALYFPLYSGWREWDPFAVTN